MKRCGICGLNKRKSSFNKHVSTHDGLQSRCKKCKRKESRQYYKKHAKRMRKQILLSRRKRIEENYVKLLKFLEVKKCVDCGEGDPIVLDFDHVNGNKIFDIGSFVSRGYSWERTFKEIKKCVVRCANCHRRKTAREGNFRRLRIYERVCSSSGRAPGS